MMYTNTRFRILKAAYQAILLVCILMKAPLYAKADGAVQVIYCFGATVADGISPIGKLTIGANGDLVGVTLSGGAAAGGTIFDIPITGGLCTVLHSFGSISLDGASPRAGLLSTGSGIYFGTTYNGGEYERGTLFEVNADGTGYTGLYSFSGGTDGSNPRSLLSSDNSGNLFGTTSGSDGGSGAFVTWNSLSMIPLVVFSGIQAPSDSSGVLTLGQDGYWYGTSIAGGAHGHGCVWRSASDGSQFRELYSFSGGKDGGGPTGGVIDGKDGYLYGTATLGGTYNAGVAFRVAAASGALTVLHSFGRTGDGIGSEGFSVAGLLLSTDGYLYGVCAGGGSSGLGTVFRLSRDGTDYRIVHNFIGTQGSGECDGEAPSGALIQAPDGYLYGCTHFGGENDLGTVYRLAISVGSITSCSPPSGVTGASFTLTVNGSGFVSTSQVLWNGTPLATSFVNSGQLTATVPAADVASPGTASIAVFNKTPGGGTSNTIAFQVNSDQLAGVSAPASGGAPGVTGTIQLSGPAPQGGTVVWLTTNSAVASVPAYVLAPAGSLSASFFITLKQVSAPATVAVTAWQGTTTASCNVNVLIVTAVAVNPATCQVLQPTHLTATLTVNGAAVANEPVTFLFGTHVIGQAFTDANGLASLAYTPPLGMVGEHNVTGSFAGDVHYSAASGTGWLKVVAAPTAFSVAGVSCQVGQAATLSATLSSNGAAVQNEQVAFQVDGQAVSSATTDANGVARISYTPQVGGVGSHTIVATFAGDSNYTATTGTGSLSVSKANGVLSVASISATSGQRVQLSATLTAYGPAVSGKKIVIQLDGSQIGIATTNSAGTAAIAYTASASVAGSHTITAIFAGDASYSRVTGSGTLTVARAVTAITVSNVSGQIGQVVTFTARLMANGKAVGGRTLAFSVDSGSTVSAVTAASGTAQVSYSIPSGAAGNHTITVSFAGDSSYVPASGTGKLAVSKVTTHTAVVAGQATVGQPVTLTAKLIIAGAGGLSGKTIHFSVGSADVGSAQTDTTGTATLTWVVSAPVGSLSVRAVFPGDVDYNSSSGTTTLTVSSGNTSQAASRVSSQQGSLITLSTKSLSGTLNLSGRTLACSIDGVAVGSAPTGAGSVFGDRNPDSELALIAIYTG
jgi:uncharacterized repeat protein (TIGR03803 family)